MSEAGVTVTPMVVSAGDTASALSMRLSMICSAAPGTANAGAIVWRGHGDVHPGFLGEGLPLFDPRTGHLGQVDLLRRDRSVVGPAERQQPIDDLL